LGPIGFVPGLGRIGHQRSIGPPRLAHGAWVQAKLDPNAEYHRRLRARVMDALVGEPVVLCGP